MDLATLIGLVGGIGIMISAIVLGGSGGMFVNPPSLLIVFGGVFAVVMMKFSLGQFLGAVKVAVQVFKIKMDKPEDLINELEEMADVARKEGFLALEGREINNGFLSKGIQMLIDGHGPEVVRGVMGKEMQQAVDRHSVGQKIFKGLGDYAPAMGMIGTLIGLVQMLANMSDPKAIGPAMAVALLTTLYGAMLANLVALPIADKLGLRSNEERMINSLIIDGVSAIQAGQNPRVIKEMLLAYLPGSKRPKPEGEE